MQEPQKMQVQSLGQEDPLWEEMATHSSIFAWKVPRTEEPGGLQSEGPKKLNTREKKKQSFKSLIELKRHIKKLQAVMILNYVLN